MSEAIARFLFSLLDDIDTVGDIAKADDRLYREMVERLHRRRFEVASTDGYTVTFHTPAAQERNAWRECIGSEALFLDVYGPQPGDIEYRKMDGVWYRRAALAVPSKHHRAPTE